MDKRWLGWLTWTGAWPKSEDRSGRFSATQMELIVEKRSDTAPVINTSDASGLNPNELTEKQEASSVSHRRPHVA